MTFVREFFRFLLRRRKYWMFPVMIVMFIIGSIIVFSEGSVIAPLIYTIF